MPSLHYTTAGESHGKGLMTIITGLPYGVPFNIDFVNSELARRQGGYGRGARMKMERDVVEVLSGIRNGRTLGSPLTLMIPNRVANTEELGALTKPRPGHADLAGAMKLGIADARDISERASARETAARVAAGATANAFLSLFNVHVCGYVIEIGGVTSSTRITGVDELKRKRDASLFYCLDAELDDAIKKKVDEAKANGDTLGGVFEVAVFNAPAGLGSFAGWKQKLDGAIARALMSVQTVKGVEIGLGFAVSRLRGSEVHDEIRLDEKGRLRRRRNNAGGIEGGMSNGEPIVARAACKPISTLRKPLSTVDLASKEATQAQYERSDVCVVPAASVIGEAVVGFEIARAFLEKFGGDTFEETKERYEAYLRKLEARFKKV